MIPPSEWKFQRELTAADKAVVHVLRRISRDPDARWAFGFCTESFHLLCEAYADLINEPIDDVKTYLIEHQAAGKSAAEVLRDLLDRDDDVSAAIREVYRP